MSENTFDDVADDATTGQPDSASGQTPKAVREYAERVAAENKALKAKLEARDQADKKAKLDAFVKDKKLDEKAVELIGDRDPEEWFKEYGHMFASQGGNDDTPQDQNPPAPSVPTGQADQIRSMSEIQPGQFSPGSESQLSADLDNLDATATSDDEFFAGLRKMGALGG
jgi:hypothetical protein